MKKRCAAAMIGLVLLLSFSLPISTAVSASRTLTILNYTDVLYPRFRYALAAFQAMHPDVEVSIREMHDTDDLLETLAGTSGVDIVYLYRKQLMENAQAGALVPLDAVPKVMAALEANEWLPIAPLLSLDGQLYGVAHTAYASLRDYDASAAEVCGFVLPEYPYSWEDILSAALEVDWEGRDVPCLIQMNLANPSFLMDYLAWQYAQSGAVNLYAEELQEALRCFQTLVQLGLVVDSRSGAREPCVFGGQEGLSLIKNPVIGACPCVTVSVSAFALSKNAKNPDLAADFLSILASRECQTQSPAYMDSMLLKDASGYPDDPLELRERPSDELRFFVAEHWAPSFSYAELIHYLEDTQIVARYLKGDQDMPLETLLTLIQEKANLMLAK